MKKFICPVCRHFGYFDIKPKRCPVCANVVDFKEEVISMKEKRNNENHKMPYGYPVNSGYEGWVVDRFMLFATEQDYLDWIDWYNNEAEDD